MKKALFWQYAILALLGIAGGVGGYFAYGRLGDGALFWLICAGILLLLAGCCLLLAHLSAQRILSPLQTLAEQLEKKRERIVFTPHSKAEYPEIAALREDIQHLGSKLVNARFQLKAEKERTRRMFAEMSEGILVLDRQQKVLDLNRIAAQVLGLSIDDVGKNFRSLVYDHDLRDAVDHALQNNHNLSLDLSTVDGSIYLLRITHVRENSLQSSVHLLLSMTDVTDSRNALKQRQDFFSNASHELKTPITSILGFAELLEAGLITEPERAMDSVKVIRREAKRMCDLINDLLLIASLENSDGVQRADTTAVPLEIANEIQEMLSPDIQSRHLTMETSGGGFSVPIPYVHLRNLLSNLMQNAVKYNVEGGSIWVRIETDDTFFYLTVKDTGIGIPADLQSRVFERFFRVDKGRSRSVGGTGLGLSIVKHIVALYNGELSMESTPGEGTTISVKLKIPEEKAAG